jgi:hypothetical protein
MAGELPADEPVIHEWFDACRWLCRTLRLCVHIVIGDCGFTPTCSCVVILNSLTLRIWLNAKYLMQNNRCDWSVVDLMMTELVECYMQG